MSFFPIEHYVKDGFLYNQISVMEEYKISIIVPIYKVEKFLEKCVEALMKQTIKEVEYIFVNDATPDRSMAILEDVLLRYPDRRESVTIVSHEINKGLPAARNTGLNIAKGKYIYHCDSDDYMDEDMLQVLYDEAVMKQADIVWCDWFLTFEKNERYMKQPNWDTPEAALRSMLGGGMKYNVWNKLIRRTLYTDYRISFPEGHALGEDMTIMLLFAHSKKVAYVPKAFYHYVKMNSNAISRVYPERMMCDLKYNVNRITHALEEIYGDMMKKEIAFLKLEAKFPFLIIGDTKLYHIWKEWYPEANQFILRNYNISLRNRLLQWFAWKGQFWLVWLHYWLVCRLIYGVIYR